MSDFAVSEVQEYCTTQEKEKEEYEQINSDGNQEENEETFNIIVNK